MRVAELNKNIFEPGMPYVVVDILPQWGQYAIATLSRPQEFNLIAEFLEKTLDLYIRDKEVVDITGRKPEPHPHSDRLIAHLIRFSPTVNSELINIVRSQVVTDPLNDSLGLRASKDYLKLKQKHRADFAKLRRVVEWDTLISYLADN